MKSEEQIRKKVQDLEAKLDEAGRLHTKYSLAQVTDWLVQLAAYTWVLSEDD
jgi:hypothetical protein